MLQAAALGGSLYEKRKRFLLLLITSNTLSCLKSLASYGNQPTDPHEVAASIEKVVSPGLVTAFLALLKFLEDPSWLQPVVCTVSKSVSKSEKERKEKSMLFSDRNRSLLRQQPGAWSPSLIIQQRVLLRL